ncbi:Serine palmitoyltransferase 2 [Venturia inaequalis]|nr:Serine palmitoyltransferase 2 [Venturia inaequalis]
MSKVRDTSMSSLSDTSKSLPVSTGSIQQASFHPAQIPTKKLSDEQQPAEPPPRKPTSFFSLPRELRQEILFAACKPYCLNEPIRMSVSWKSLEMRTRPFRQIDQRLDIDIAYVEETWARRILKLEREDLDEVIWRDSILQRFKTQLLWHEEAMLVWDEGGREKIYNIHRSVLMRAT